MRIANRGRIPPLLALGLLLPGTRVVVAQDDPRAARPERPTIATHAWTVAPRYVELETGLEWDRNADQTRTVSTPTQLKIGLGPRTQLGLQTTLNRPSDASVGLGDVGLVLKYRIADRHPLLGAFAVLPGLKLPVGDAVHGTTTTDFSLLLISSRQLGPAALDVNLGYTHRSGDGSHAPKDATLWTVSAGIPVRGPVGLALELFGYPGTRGPSGSPGTVALLAGPTFTVRPPWTLDAGGILHLRGPQPDALYVGLVYNFGEL